MILSLVVNQVIMNIRFTLMMCIKKMGGFGGVKKTNSFGTP